jgi:hypothetical protein
MRNDVRLIDGAESNWATVYTANAGDVERAFRNAAYTRREQFRVQRNDPVGTERNCAHQC